MTLRETSHAARVSVPARIGPWLAVFGLWVWSNGTTPWPLLLGAVGLVGAVVLPDPPRKGRVRAAGLAVLTLAILVGFAAERQVTDVVEDWDGYWAQRVDRIGDLLSDELDRRQLAGEAAADALVERWTLEGAPLDPAVVREIRSRYAASALALYDPDGKLVVWDGTHRGLVPEEVQRGERRQSYRDLPLFGYLYLTSEGADGSVAAAAYLLRASLPAGLDADMGDLATRFLRETGERIRITEDDPGIAEAVWDLALDDDRLLSVVLDRPGTEERADAIRARWSAVVFALGTLAWLCLAFGGPIDRTERVGAAVTLIAAGALVPLDSVETLRTLFDPMAYGLLPRGPTLGRAALVATLLFVLVPVLPPVRRVLGPVAGGVIVALAFPVMLLGVAPGLGDGALASSRLAWATFQLLGSACLGLVAGLTMAAIRPGGSVRWAMWGSVAAAITLVSGVGAIVAREGVAPTALTALWGVPFVLGAFGVRALDGWRRPVGGWALSVFLASSATIPIVWGLSVESRLERGEQTLARIAAVEDAVTEERLFAFARVADSLDTAGAEDVTILYEGWRLSGLSGLGQPVRLQIERRDGSPGEGLRVAAAEGEPQPYQQIVADGRRVGGARLAQLDEDDARYILTLTLRDGRMVVAVVPPFPVSSGRAGLGPLVRSTGELGIGSLTVLPVPEDGPVSTTIGRERTERGWQVDTGLSYSTGTRYRALYEVGLPGVPLRVARATLLTALNLAFLMAAMLLGRALRGERERRELRLWGLPISFRGRVTLALFGFFVLANAIFGTLAYQTLAQASRRSAQVIAERMVEDAAGWYRALDGQMERLASQVGAELLEYRDGALREGSVEELVQLGLYEGWAPYDVHEQLEGYDAVREFRQTSLGRWEYGTAYRRLPDGDLLAAQIPLQAGASALQTTELIELLAFAMLLGAGLSLGLAMAAGQALTRPIEALKVASESVGSGDLAMRLPSHRQDEFGAVFRAFNRMVGRVRRARRQLVRTSRRTQLIMDEAAVGMVALDPVGAVTLVNPRAEELLGTEVTVGERLPASGELGEALSEWLGGYLRGNADEADSDIQTGERRVRVRARRLGTYGTRRGVVVALDDVTDELRAERVLAWGEMARQVAHEVKNPLTPIKLSIQHVRRAWSDGHPDFDRILVRNADAMLGEIDRLAEIAQSFSRFGAPGEQVLPLAPVSVGDVVDEVMALYGSSAARVRFEQDLERSLPPVVARTAELKEVLVNLLENARLAGERGTRVTIGARRLSGERVELTVADDGVGIPPEVLPRIFEPQFSTRSKGTGLGLAIVQRVVRAWGGTVSVDSEQGRGTVVTVELQVWPVDGDAAGSGATEPDDA
jgi:signal transduction histidine kinase